MRTALDESGHSEEAAQEPDETERKGRDSHSCTRAAQFRASHCGNFQILLSDIMSILNNITSSLPPLAPQYLLYQKQSQ